MFMLKTYNTHVAEHEKKEGFTHNLTVLFRDKQKTDTKENFFVWSKLSLD